MRIYLGKPRYRDSGALYDAFLDSRDGEMIVRGSTEPFFDACRALVAKGITGRLEMVGPDPANETVRLSGDIEWFATRTVVENAKIGPYIAKYVQSPWRGGQISANRSGEVLDMPQAETWKIEGHV